MSPAKLTPAQIRDRKAKRVAVVLVVVFVGALAIQGPKLLKMIHRSSPPVSAACRCTWPQLGGSELDAGCGSPAATDHDGLRPR